MPLPVGTKLGPYEIVAPLGVGGMGEVYRARDTRLKRDVAIKVLPAGVAADPARLGRFQREAEILASLNHPGIASIYGLSENSLVMELVEGETLPCPVPVETAIAYAKQMVEAIEYAHDRGVIHRDLKPANIKVTAEGIVKILDFGLAKALDERATAGEDPMNSPTLSMGATAAGVILGTAAYMSPEQAVGKSADRRADIFSFGAVLYEMLAGKRAFQGRSAGETLAAVVKDAPDWQALQAGTPSHVRKLLERSLEKDRKQRLQSIGEARIILERGEIEAPAPTKPRMGRLWPGLAVVLGVAAAALALIHFREAPPVERVVSSVLLPPDGVEFDFTTRYARPALSPDGTRIVFGAKRKDSNTELWMRRLDSPTAQPLAGTEGADDPFWSADSRWVGFGQGKKLKKIDIQGGPPITIADLPELLTGASWSPQGVIILGTNHLDDPLLQISASGGSLVPATTREPGEKGYLHRFPWLLPDGRHFLYSSGQIGTAQKIRVGSLDDPSKPGKVVGEAQTEAAYAQGYLLYRREGTLVAQPFDLDRLESKGEPVPLPTSANPSSVTAVAVSTDGLLAYQSKAATVQSRLVWKDRLGKTIENLGEPKGRILEVAIAPDGKHVAATIRGGSNDDLWIYDAVRGLPIRFTFNFASNPVWSPDSGTLFFAHKSAASLDLFRKAANGAGTDELLWSDSVDKFPFGTSPDGKLLLFKKTVGADRTDFWVLPLTGGAPGAKPEPRVFLETPFDVDQGQFSPDGRWFAYDSNESGQYEIYATPLPGPGGKRQISSGGGHFPLWRHDGRELFYATPDGRLMAAQVAERNGTLELGEVRKLFGGLVRPLGRYIYDVSADGQKFLLIEDDDTASSHPLTLVQNWPMLLKR